MKKIIVLFGKWEDPTQHEVSLGIRGVFSGDVYFCENRAAADRLNAELRQRKGQWGEVAIMEIGVKDLPETFRAYLAEAEGERGGQPR